MSALTMILESTGSGFSGISSYDPTTDDLGHMTMTEAAAYLPIVIMENSIEAAREEAKVNDALVESVVMAHLSGSEPDYQVISENALQSAWTKIKNFFRKIIEAIKRIIAKIRVFIDSVFMKAQAFASKYEKSPELKNKDFSKLSFEGYKFVDNISDIWDSKITVNSPEALNKMAAIAVNVPKLTDPLETKVAMQVDTLDDKPDGVYGVEFDVDKLKDVDASDRQSNLVKHIIGKDLDDTNIREALLKELMGSDGKVEIKYGSNGFEKGAIISYLKKPDDLTKLKKKYEDLEKTARNQESKVKRQADNHIINDSDTKAKVDTRYATYISAYGTILGDVYGIISTIQDAKLTAAQAKIKQNTAMLRKLLNIDQKKIDKMNEEFDDIDDSDLNMEI